MRKIIAFFAVAGMFVGWLDTGKSHAQNYNAGYSERSVCDRAAKSAAQVSGVPILFLQAIARAESGLTVEGMFNPWPWTVNVAGQGKYFTTKKEASRFVKSKLKSGARNIDVGCFQISIKWHGQNFESIDQLLDPAENARYAASFLKKLYEELGSWQAAAGAYHSRTRELADLYVARLTPIVKELNTAKVENGAGLAKRPRNDFPLLRGHSDSAGRGSLFPQSDSTNRRWFADLERQG